MSAFNKSLSPLKEIGRMPQPGYSNPRFWTPEKKTPDIPEGGFQSTIDTSAPIKAGDMRAILNVTKSAPTYGSDSGKASLRAMDDSFANMTINALGKAADDLNVKTRAQAEKSQAEQILGEKQSATDRFTMDRNVESFGRNTWQRLQQGYKDLAQYVEEEKKNASARFWSAFLGSL